MKKSKKEERLSFRVVREFICPAMSQLSGHANDDWYSDLPSYLSRLFVEVPPCALLTTPILPSSDPTQPTCE
jgi:hypothetical protein